jgi:CubicO group peptidase (beta-lactamase class C family)
MQELHERGAAVGIVQDGKVILAKGYGVRQIGDYFHPAYGKVHVIGRVGIWR